LTNIEFEFEFAVSVDVGVEGGGDGVRFPPPPRTVAGIAVAVGIGRRRRVIDLWIGGSGPYRYEVDSRGEKQNEMGMGNVVNNGLRCSFH
jgi:hypothetical protein